MDRLHLDHFGMRVTSTTTSTTKDTVTVDASDLESRLESAHAAYVALCQRLDELPPGLWETVRTSMVGSLERRASPACEGCGGHGYRLQMIPRAGAMPGNAKVKCETCAGSGRVA